MTRMTRLPGRDVSTAARLAWEDSSGHWAGQTKEGRFILETYAGPQSSGGGIASATRALVWAFKAITRQAGQQEGRKKDVSFLVRMACS